MKRGLPWASRPTFSAWKPSTSFCAEIASSTSSSSNCGGRGNCTRMPWIFGSAFSAAIFFSTFSGGVSAGNSYFSECTPTASQALILLRT